MKKKKPFEDSVVALWVLENERRDERERWLGRSERRGSSFCR